MGDLVRDREALRLDVKRATFSKMGDLVRDRAVSGCQESNWLDREALRRDVKKATGSRHRGFKTDYEESNILKIGRSG
jgi:hypothetical protein